MAVYKPLAHAPVSKGSLPADSSIEPTSSTLDDLLRRASAEVREVWNADTPNLRRFEDLRTRLSTGRFHLAVLGQFKRGKSTFLNALLGEDVLPTGIVPLTALPTFISWAPAPVVQVWYRGAKTPKEFRDTRIEEIRRHLFRFVAEEANPNNRLDVARVELLYPSPLLHSGVVLIDTPGIGSTHRHNTDTAFQVLPECDAAVFVVSADPPITQAETDYLAAIRPNVARLMFVLSKADYLAPNDRQTAVDFLRTVLSSLLPPTEPPVIFSLSALRGLHAKQANDAAGVKQSGVGILEDYLLEYLAQEKTTTLHAAVAKKASTLLTEAVADLAMRVRALELPIEDLERRRATLAEALAAIDDEKRVIRDFLAGDRRRMGEQLEIEAERIRADTRGLLFAEAFAAHVETGEKPRQDRHRTALAQAIPQLFQRELREALEKFRRNLEEVLGRQQTRVEALVGRVRQTAAELFEIPFAKPDTSEPFTLTQEPYWVTQKWNDTLIPAAPRFFGRLLPASVRAARIRRELEAQVTEIVLRNVENLRWAILRSIDDAFRRFTSLFDERLAAALAATQGAVEAVSVYRRTKTNDIAGELTRLHEFVPRLNATSTELTEMDAALSRTTATPS